MGLTSLQVCMDSSEWLQGTVHEDSSGMDSSSSPSGDMLACSRPLAERRLRPPHDQALNCPRCDSTHTKFCYYNNYSLSQPRYFCKTCRRYWTKGGTLRNIPVGGGCRKNNSNKKLSSKHKPNATVSSAGAPTDLHLSSLLEAHHHHLLNNNNFMVDSNVINPRNYDFMGNNNVGDDHVSGFHGISSPFGFMGLDHGNNNNIGTGFFPYEVSHQEQQSVIDVKPKVLSLEWQDQQQLQGCCDIGNDSFGYGIGSWAGMFNSYGSSTANPLV